MGIHFDQGDIDIYGIVTGTNATFPDADEDWTLEDEIAGENAYALLKNSVVILEDESEISIVPGSANMKETN